MASRIMITILEKMMRGSRSNDKATFPFELLSSITAVGHIHNNLVI